MPFSASDLSALTSANGFTLWHYRTVDDRADVLAPGYFASAATILLPGHVVIVQAADATAIVPIRGGTLPGTGVVVDGAGGTPALLRSATLRAEVTLTALGIARAIALDPVPGFLFSSDPLAAGATVTGPISQVTFTLRNAAGADVAAPQTVPVIAGRAGATFTALPPGSGYRVRAAETADPSLAALSAPFVVVRPAQLVTEAGGRLLLETGASLLR